MPFQMSEKSSKRTGEVTAEEEVEGGVFMQAFIPQSLKDVS
jgi:hypothetical protein